PSSQGEQAGVDESDSLQRLQSQIEAGTQQTLLLDRTLRRLTETEATSPLPRELTRRARRALELGRGLLGQLRALAEELDNDNADADPLARLYGDTVAMTDSALRLVQAFPDSPSAQLHLCKEIGRA